MLINYKSIEQNRWLWLWHIITIWKSLSSVSLCRFKYYTAHKLLRFLFILFFYFKQSKLIGSTWATPCKVHYRWVDAMAKHLTLLYVYILDLQKKYIDVYSVRISTSFSTQWKPIYVLHNWFFFFYSSFTTLHFHFPIKSIPVFIQFYMFYSSPTIHIDIHIITLDTSYTIKYEAPLLKVYIVCCIFCYMRSGRSII